jgi:hypothetical protein
MQITPVDRALAEGLAGPDPFQLAVNRGPAKPVAAPDSFGAVIDAMDESAGRVEAQRLAGDLANNVDKNAKHEARRYRSAMAIQQRQQGVGGNGTFNAGGGF